MSSCTATLFFPLGLPATCISHSGPNDACVVLLWTASWGLQPNTSTVTMSARVGRWICMSASLFFSLRLRLSHFCTASPPLSLASIAMCTRHSGQNAAYALLWAAEWGLQPNPPCYHVNWGWGQCRTVSGAPHLCPSSSPSDVSMCVSLKLVCVLSIESFVEL